MKEVSIVDKKLLFFFGDCKVLFIFSISFDCFIICYVWMHAMDKSFIGVTAYQLVICQVCHDPLVTLFLDIFLLWHFNFLCSSFNYLVFG